MTARLQLRPKPHLTVGDRLQLPDVGLATVRQVRTGRLGSTIARLRLDDGRAFYLKQGVGEASEDIEAETERLEWLRGRLPVPVAHRLPLSEDGAFRVLLEAIPGRPSHYARLPESQRVDILAEALRDIHGVPVADCPFRDTLKGELAEAERRLRLGMLDVPGFIAATQGVTPAQALDRLQADASMVRETVFTHGDYCLPNVMIQRSRLSGVIDWGISGVGDPHRDFMALVESIEFNLGPSWVRRFFDAYGGPEPDQDRIRYFSLLDQFFGHYQP